MNCLKSVLLGAFIVTGFQTLADSPASSVVALRSYPYQFNDHRFAADFSKTLVFGSSISADVRSSTLGTSLDVLDFTHGYESSPGEILSEVYAGQPTYENVATALPNPEVNLIPPSISFDFEWYQQGLGRLLDFMGQAADSGFEPAPDTAQMQQYYKSSTAIVGVDAFYMGVLFNQCSYISPDVVISKFVNQAFQDGKIVILGNMPDDKFDRMTWLSKLAITANISPEWKTCKDAVNTALHNYCTTDKNCYVVNLEKIVAGMDKNNGAELATDHKKYTYSQLRPDGANLSSAGTQLIVEKVLAKMAKHPPQAPTNSATTQP